MKEYINNILLPYIKEKRRSLNLADYYLALVLFDNFQGSMYPRFSYPFRSKQYQCGAYPTKLHRSSSTPGRQREQSGEKPDTHPVSELVRSTNMPSMSGGERKEAY